MTESAVGCPHCGIGNVMGAAFCGACGKALPVGESGPRVISGKEMPTSSAGAKLVGDDLTKRMKTAARTLLGVGILEWVVCGILALVLASRGADSGKAVIALLPLIVVGAIFVGLYFWARTAPLPASIVGLIIYCTLVVINVVTHISAMAANPNGNNTGGIGIGVLDILIIALLLHGVSAALKYRKLLAAQTQ